MSWKAKIKSSFKPDVVLTFASEQDFLDWVNIAAAVPFAESELGSRKFYIVQGRIVEAVINPPKPKQFSGSVEVSGDLPREIRKFLDEDREMKVGV